MKPKNRKLVDTLSSFDHCHKDAREIFIERNNHFENRFVEDGVKGILIRIKDKIKDVEQGGREDENIYECLLDISNYALMGATLTKED